jgi:hypothetical protein
MWAVGAPFSADNEDWAEIQMIDQTVHLNALNCGHLVSHGSTTIDKTRETSMSQ